jgi:chitinase
VLLSLGGAYPTNYTLATAAISKYFAEFLWGAFGPVGSGPASWVAAGSPRPFGTAAVDGFDFDIESDMTSPPFADYKSRGYADMINHFKNVLYPTASGTYYISGAPQCITPDSHLDSAMMNAPFDFLYVQFYNTPQCSVRAAYNGLSTFTFDSWVSRVTTLSKNKSAKVYLGIVSVIEVVLYSQWLIDQSPLVLLAPPTTQLHISIPRRPMLSSPNTTRSTHLPSAV